MHTNLAGWIHYGSNLLENCSVRLAAGGSVTIASRFFNGRLGSFPYFPLGGQFCFRREAFSFECLNNPEC
jgi:hypothetical protein